LYCSTGGEWVLNLAYTPGRVDGVATIAGHGLAVPIGNREWQYTGFGLEAARAAEVELQMKLKDLVCRKGLFEVGGRVERQQSKGYYLWSQVNKLAGNELRILVRNNSPMLAPSPALAHLN
jgi:hypothetical protein